MSQKKHITVVAGVVYKQDQILITLRKKDTHLGGLWEFPGGKMEAGETHHQSLKRELREELGIEVAVQDVLQEITYDYPERLVSLAFYRCELNEDSPDPKAREVADWKWVNTKELSQYPFPEANRDLLDMICQ